MKHQDISEIVLGLVLAGQVSPDHVDAQTFYPPYGEAIKLLRGGADVADLYDKVGLAPIKAATDAAQAVKEHPVGEWLKLLDRSYSREELATILERQTKRLRNGEDADTIALEGAIEKHINLEHRYETADKIEPYGGAWMETGYKPLDRHMGGLPLAGLTTVAATTGIGKTTFLVQLASHVAKLNRKVLLYTLEQTRGQLVKRILDTLDGGDDSFRKNITICDDQMNVNELSAESSRVCSIEQIGFIGVDFVDLLLNEEEDEPKVAHIYRTLAQLAKKTEVPVVAVAQLHRYEGGEPRINNIRWSGLAEAMSAMIALLYNPAQTFGIGSKKDGQLPLTPGKAWILIGKSRYGFKEGGVGAIQVDWDSKKGWGQPDSSWRSMVM